MPANSVLSDISYLTWESDSWPKVSVDPVSTSSTDSNLKKGPLFSWLLSLLLWPVVIPRRHCIFLMTLLQTTKSRCDEEIKHVSSVVIVSDLWVYLCVCFFTFMGNELSVTVVSTVAQACSNLNVIALLRHFSKVWVFSMSNRNVNISVPALWGIFSPSLAVKDQRKWPCKPCVFAGHHFYHLASL